AWTTPPELPTDSTALRLLFLSQIQKHHFRRPGSCHDRIWLPFRDCLHGQLTPVITPDQYQAKTQQAAQQNQSAFTPDQTPSLQNFIAPDSPLQPVQPSRFVSGRQEIYPDYNAASDSVTNMPAGPDVVLVGGSSSGTKLVRADEKGAVIDYDVTRRYSWSGITFKYDDYGTRNIETADLSAMPALRFAILTDAGSLKMEVEDGSGVRDTIDLVNATGLAGVERIYEIRRDQLSARLDWTRIRFINFVIDQEHAITGKFQGRLAVRAGGFDSPYQYPVAPTNLASYIYDPMPGNPRAEVTGGSTGGTRVTAIDANTRLLAYNVTPTGSWSGVSYYYDNFSTSKIETYDFSNSPFIAAAVKGDATNVQLEIEDAKGKRVNLLLENLNSTEETVYQIDLSKIASKIDISQVRFVNFVVSQNTVAVDKRTGNLTVRFGQFTQDTTAPLVVATSAALTNNPDYLLTYTVDGVAKTRTETLVEGVNTLTITEQDAAGNVTNQTFNVTLDTKSPEVIVASSNITNKSNYVLSYTADGVLVTKPVTLAEGDNILNISARDAIGNETKTSFKVTLDTKAPVVVATSAALTNKLDYLLTYTVDGVTKTRPVTLTEGLNTLQIAEQDLAGNQTNLNFDVTLDTKAPEIKFSSATLTNNPSYTLTYTTDGQQMTKPVTLVEGENTLDVVERDLAGNETKTNLKVTLDTVAPSITFQSPDLVNRPDYQLIYQVDGATKLMLFTLTEGKNALSLTERDLAGNEVTASLEVLLDTTAPDVKFSSTTLTNKSDYTLTYSSDGIQKTQAVTLVEGDNVLDVIERDLAGNETKTSLKVMLDTIAPVVAATSVALTNNPDYTLSYTVDGVTKTRPLTLTEGLNTLQIAEQDLAGNKTKTSLSVTLDTKAPEIIFSSPILVNKSDYTLTYTTDGQQVTRPVTLVEGDNVLDVVERDLAGNETKTSLKVTLDTIAPVVVATSVALTNKPDYTVSYTVDGVTKTRPVTLTEGLNTLQIAEQDLASNQTKLNFDVTLDTIAPEVIFSSPTLTNNPSYTLTYTTDGQQVTKPVTLVERDNFLDVVRGQ
ncbi:MAG: hypothetical protein HZC17_01670, partial [Candidatus Omnitrophica bacterium]|nr:hypothetical protein [Candidatus Omnitrophota bacterium]